MAVINRPCEVITELLSAAPCTRSISQRPVKKTPQFTRGFTGDLGSGAVESSSSGEGGVGSLSSTDVQSHSQKENPICSL